MIERLGYIIIIFIFLACASSATSLNGTYTIQLSGDIAFQEDCDYTKTEVIEPINVNNDGSFRIPMGLGCDDGTYDVGASATIRGILTKAGDIENLSVSGHGSALRWGYASERSDLLADATGSANNERGCRYRFSGTFSGPLYHSSSINALSDISIGTGKQKGSLKGKVNVVLDATDRYEDLYAGSCKKSKGKHPSPVNTDELIMFIKKVEADNPDMTWQEIVTKLHIEYYPVDSNLQVPFQIGSYKFFEVGLFKSGKDNKEYDSVGLDDCKPPKYMNGSNGRIDISHTYAIVRAGINRGMGTAWTMKKINGDWGDYMQVAGGYIKGTVNMGLGFIGGYYHGLTGNNKGVKNSNAKYNHGKSQWANAPTWRPPDQAKGNKIGMDIASYLDSNHHAKLSEAYTHVLKKSGDVGSFDEPCMKVSVVYG